MKLDIHTAVQTTLVIAILLIIVSAWIGIRSIAKARSLKFFRMRRDRMVAGWRLILLAFGLGIMALAVNSFAEPLVYRFFPPTPTLTPTLTITVTPSITLSPTITQTPTITNTPSETDTPTITPTPQIPLVVEILFQSTTTPNPGAVFSPLQFTQELITTENTFEAVNPGTVFQNPVGHLYALFSYVDMVVDSQWTALWYRNGELVNYETKPWDGGSGGWGYTDWNPPAEMWQPGEYEVQIFVGHEWKIAGKFTVEGDAPTAVPSLTPSPTRTNTPSPTPTRTPTPSRTLTPTRTTTPTRTVTLTRTNTPTTKPSSTRQPSNTPRPTDTHQPSRTITRTPAGTATPRPTSTHAPTYTPAPPTAPYTHAPTFTPRPPTANPTRAPTNTPRLPTVTPGGKLKNPAQIRH